MLANIALALLGKTSVNLNYTAATEVVQSALRQCGAKHVLTARRFDNRVKLDPGPGVELLYLEDMLPKITKGQKLRAFLTVVLLPGWWLEYVTLGLGRHSVDDLATIIFSSGSTGDPKGVMLTHGNIAANAESMIQAASLTDRDRLLGVLPFFHSFGYTVTLWVPLQVGGVDGLPRRPARRPRDRRTVPDAPLHHLPLDADVPALLPEEVRAGRFPDAAPPRFRGGEAAAVAGRRSSRRSSASCRWKATAAPSCRRWWRRTCPTWCSTASSRSATAPAPSASRCRAWRCGRSTRRRWRPLPVGEEGLAAGPRRQRDAGLPAASRN